jgi:hypothetical protein
MSGSKQRPSHASDSSVQREAELVALKALSNSLGVQLASCKLEISELTARRWLPRGAPGNLAEVFAQAMSSPAERRLPSRRPTRPCVPEHRPSSDLLPSCASTKPSTAPLLPALAPWPRGHY